MNSDPHESAAWRTFGMLDADEAAGFDEAMRQDPTLQSAYREMNTLAAAVAAVTVVPITPRAGQYERLQSRLGLAPAKSLNWAGISGWAAAAVLTAAFIIDRQFTAPTPTTAQNTTTPPVAPHASPTIAPAPTVDENAAVAVETPTGPPAQTQETAVMTQETEAKVIARVETKRLIQEIEVLREKLASSEKRDKKRFDPVPGMAWPIVMTMKPPHADRTIIAANQIEDSSITNILGDALAGTSNLAVRNTSNTANTNPSAVPIYDPATGEGTLVVDNLASIKSPLLWIVPEGENKTPLIVGKLPNLNANGPESVGFSLSPGTVPENFIITSSVTGAAEAPDDKNTILIGPR